MPVEPPLKRAITFIDAQNLFHAAKEAFGHRHPNFDPLKLAATICARPVPLSVRSAVLKGSAARSCSAATACHAIT